MRIKLGDPDFHRSPPRHAHLPSRPLAGKTWLHVAFCCWVELIILQTASVEVGKGTNRGESDGGSTAVQTVIDFGTSAKKKCRGGKLQPPDTDISTTYVKHGILH